MTGPGSDRTDMSPDEFREWGRRFVEWVAEYLAEVGGYPVMAQVAPGDVRTALDAEAPELGEPMESLLRDFESVIVPGTTHWNHPGFFGYYAISGTGPGILAELLAAALNVNAMVWRASPAATELEETTLDWLRRFLALPSAFAGTINDTASISTFHALAAARERGLPEARERGAVGCAPRADLRHRRGPLVRGKGCDRPGTRERRGDVGSDGPGAADEPEGAGRGGGLGRGRRVSPVGGLWRPSGPRPPPPRTRWPP